MTHCYFIFFFFNDTATTEIYTLSLHDALPIWEVPAPRAVDERDVAVADRARSEMHRHLPRSGRTQLDVLDPQDRKSTRLNSSHSQISYAVFCLKKKQQQQSTPHSRSH